jgi:NHL repeat
MKTPTRQAMRTPTRLKPALLLTTTATIALALALATAVGAQAATPPIKEIPESRIGAKVNATTGGDICTTASKNTCQPAEQSTTTSGFDNPGAVAVNNGTVYVADTNNHRVQEFEASGKFIRMFGDMVNKTAHLKGETANENLCPVNPGDECQAGLRGNEPGQFDEIYGLAADPVSGDIYTSETLFDDGSSGQLKFGARVQRFTPGGRFVWEIGMEVNETKDKTPGATPGEKNLCTQEEIEKAGVKCTSPTLHALSAGVASEPFMGVTKPQVAVGGPEDLVYVGDEHRVQEFETDGKYKRELPLTAISAQSGSHVTAIAVDDSCALHAPTLTESTTPTCKEFDANDGDLYLTYEVGGVIGSTNVVYKFTPQGEEIKEHFPLTLEPRETNTGQFIVLTDIITALAVDPTGRLAVAQAETLQDYGPVTSVVFGSILDGTTGHLITEFQIPSRKVDGSGASARGVAFDGEDELFAVSEGDELLGYEPVPVGELVTRPPVCVPSSESESSALISCSLRGEVNPFGIAQTDVWFGWGATCGLGLETPRISPAGIEPESAEIEGLKPNEAYCYQLTGEDENVKRPEHLTGEKVSFRTPFVAPRVVGEGSLAALGPFSAVMFGEVNPENADTRYAFQYGQCEDLDACPGALETTALESSNYGTIGTSLEASGLQPATVYHYRLIAESQGGRTTGTTGVFMTAPAPVVQAVTGAAGAVAATSAVVFGTVDPDGQAAIYKFELGVYEGANTRYGVVFSGPAGEGTAPVEETFALSGLQPGTQYAYRIVAQSGTGSTADSTATGAAQTFTTSGLPAVLEVPSVLAQLAIPAIAFPTEVAPVTVKALTRAEKLARALKACRRKPKEKQRAGCERSARKQYARSKQADNRKKG